MHLYCNEKLQFVRTMQMDFLGNDSTRSMGQLFFFLKRLGELYKSCWVLHFLP